MRCLFAAALLAAGCAAGADTPAQPQPPAEIARAQQPAEPPPAVDDPEPPPLKASPVSALTGKIKLPADGGAWPASLGVAPSPVDGKGVRVALEYGFHDMVVSPESGRFLIAERLGLNRRADRSQPTTTHFVLGDVAAGTVVGEWDIGGDYEPLDLSPDGKAFLAKQGGTKLTLFAPATDNRLAIRTFVAHDQISFTQREAAEQERELGVRWAAFVGTNRIVSAAPAVRYESSRPTPSPGSAPWTAPRTWSRASPRTGSGSSPTRPGRRWSSTRPTAPRSARGRGRCRAGQRCWWRARTGLRWLAESRVAFDS